MADQILISACLVGECCRYNGGHCKDERLLKALAAIRCIPVCPEQLGGLSTPREPAEIIGGAGNEVLLGQKAVRTRTGKDMSLTFIKGAQKTLEIARREGIKKAILKQNSPSCGSEWIYDGSFSGRLRKGEGVTAALLKKAGISVVPGCF